MQTYMYVCVWVVGLSFHLYMFSQQWESILTNNMHGQYLCWYASCMRLSSSDMFKEGPHVSNGLMPNLLNILLQVCQHTHTHTHILLHSLESHRNVPGIVLYFALSASTPPLKFMFVNINFFCKYFLMLVSLSLPCGLQVCPVAGAGATGKLPQSKVF